MNKSLALRALSEVECSCGTSFVTRELPSLSPRESVGGFEITRECPHCNGDWVGEITDNDDMVTIEVQWRDENGESEDGRVRNIFKPDLRARHSDGRRIAELIGDIATSTDVLCRYSDRLESHSSIPIEEVDRDDEIAILADINGYVAEAYSLRKRFEASVSFPEFPEQDRARELFDRYKENSRVVEGLRIYSQKEGNLPIEIAAEAGRGMNERVIVRIPLEEVRVMGSQATEDEPTGYYDGSDQYYGHLGDDHIVVSDVISEHAVRAEDFSSTLIDEVLAEGTEGFEDVREWQEHRREYAEIIRAIIDSQDS